METIKKKSELTLQFQTKPNKDNKAKIYLFSN